MITRKRKAKLEIQKIQDNLIVADVSSSDHDSSQCSNESFVSQNNLPFNASSWQDVQKKLQSIAWIQCDNPDCRKWRKVPNETIRTIRESDKWFCHQNSDLEFNSCSVAEEDVQLYDQLADRSGLKYLKSQLLPGDLVWAKMDGYCSWPGVVTPEPGTDYGHLSKYNDGEIALYHVEFLGQPHSHGWVSANNVSVFTASSVSKQGVSSHQKQGRGRKRKSYGRSRKPLCLPAAQKLKTVYKRGISVQHGIDEAMTLLPLSPSERLAKCTYVLGRQDFQQECERNDSSSRPQMSVPQPRGTDIGDLAVSSAADKTGLPVTRFTSFDSSLEHRTKEERLMLDVEMYKRNERAFVHDVTRFMMRNGLRPGKSPFWQNQSISLFQLFLAVHERGGYAQVTCRKKWATVYREVTETPCHKDVKNSCGTRLFYYRHLYPYELYVYGKDFTEVVHRLKEEMSRQSSSKDPSNTRQNAPKQQTKRKRSSLSTHGSCSTEAKIVEDEEDVASDSLREMLQAIEDTNKLDFEDGHVGNDIDITFYDDSTPSNGKLLPLTHFEPQATTLPLMPATDDQRVTSGASQSSSQSRQTVHCLENVGQAPSHQTKQCQVYTGTLQVVPSGDGNMDDDHSVSALSQQLLEELDVLQEAINFIDHEME